MFDVDETLEISGGPIKIQQLFNLRNEGHIIGICGNFHPYTNLIPQWHLFTSLIKISNERKHQYLIAVKEHIPADRYVMVGNIHPSNAPYSDKDEAELAGWEFISELDFKDGI
jgi:hypothetical protein